ncbi:hypothetical protein D9M71_513720 [compost metagenome]
MAERVEQNVVQLEIIVQQHRSLGPRVGSLGQPGNGLARVSAGCTAADQLTPLAPAFGGAAEEAFRAPQIAKAYRPHIDVVQRGKGIDRHVRQVQAHACCVRQWRQACAAHRHAIAVFDKLERRSGNTHVFTQVVAAWRQRKALRQPREDTVLAAHVVGTGGQ